MAMYQLTLEQLQQWDEGGWLSLEIQEDVIEDLDHHHITEAVVVQLADGRTAFAVSPAREVQA
jgi:hypothetical protein